MSKTTTTRNVNGKFAKGQSGNPAGRPRADKDTRKAIRDFGDLIRQVALAPVSRTRPDGRKEMITRFEAAYEQLWGSAVKGNIKAAERFFELATSFGAAGLLARETEIKALLVEDAAILEKFKAKQETENE